MALFALLKPTSQLTRIPEVDAYHLILTSQVLKDEVYRSHYARLIAMGHHVILDNDAWELGAAIGLDEMLGAVELIQQRTNKSFEVVLPDEIGNATATIARSVAARIELQQQGVESVMVIPQGTTVEEWLECAQSLLQLDPQCIAIPGHFGDEVPGGVAYLLGTLGQLTNLPIHFLGLSRDIKQIAKLAQYPQVRGIDTCKPVSWAVGGYIVSQRDLLVAWNLLPRRPPNFFELPEAAVYPNMVLENVQMIREVFTNGFSE